jgi:hypothetical protein
MPIRMVRDWTDSEPVNTLDPPAEVLFLRLIMKADDYGRFTANAKLIRSLCFPLKDGIRESDIARQLVACEKAGLIATYTAQGKPLLEIVKFGQRLRNSKAKYDPPPSAASCGELPEVPATSGLNGIETESESDVESEAEHEGESASPLVRVDPNDLLIEWNRCVGLVSVRHMTAKRKVALRVRERDPTFVEHWRAGIVRVAASDFCCGSGSTGWRASVDWFLEPDTLTKVLEGKYDNRPNGNGRGVWQSGGRSRDEEQLNRSLEACADFAENG